MRRKLLQSILFFCCTILTSFSVQGQNFWTQVRNTIDTYTPFAEPSQAIYTANDNKIYRSLSNGDVNTWTVLSGYPSVNFYKVYTRGETVYAANSNYINDKGRGIYTSTDEGVTWTKKVNGLGADTNVVSLFFLPNENILANVENGIQQRLYLSKDNAENWEFVKDLGSNQAMDILTMSNGNVLLSAGSVLYETSDNGESFTQINASLPNTLYEMISANDSIYGFSNFNVMKSKDGVTWTTIPNNFPENSLILGMVKTSGDTLYISVDGLGVLYSTDWAKTWIDVSSGIDVMQVYGLYLSRNGHLFSSPSNSGIYKSTEAVSQPVSVAGMAHSSGESFSINIYPNPANLVLNVNYKLKENRLVKLSLMNSAGEIVREIPEQPQSAGNYSEPITISGLTPGVYYLNIWTDKGTEVKKVVIDK